MMDLINYKNVPAELDEQIEEICKEMNYRKIELTGINTTSLELRSDKHREILCRDIIYNYLNTKIEEIKLRKRFIEIYGTNISEAEKRYKEWAANAIVKKEDEE